MKSRILPMKECLFNEFFGPTSVWAKELPRITGGVWGGEAPTRGGPGGAKPPRRGVKGAWPPSTDHYTTEDAMSLKLLTNMGTTPKTHSVIHLDNVNLPNFLILKNAAIMR